MICQWRTFSLIAFLAVFCGMFPGQAMARDRVAVAVIIDGPNDRLRGRVDIYVRELLALTETEFDVNIVKLQGDWSHLSIESAIDEAYADIDVDMLLVAGFVGNQLASARDEFPKPTFLPVMLDIGQLRNPPINRKSGIQNLNYLSVYADFSEDLDALAEVVPFRKLVLMMGEDLSAAIPSLKEQAVASAARKGIELIEVTHDGIDHDLMSRVPEGTDAIFVAGLPRMPSEAFEVLVEKINSAQIPSYSFVGIADVESGLLMTSSESRDLDRSARMNALNMQAVMLGELAEDQAVSSQTKKRFTINMATARRLGISPNFDVLNNSVLLNERPTAGGKQFGLMEIALEAIDKNQDLAAQQFALLAGTEEIGLARSGLLPQLGLEASYDHRNVSPVVEAGLAAEQRADGTVSLQQNIYSDSVTANYSIQKELQFAREAVLQQTRLDILQFAASAYYNVLNAQSQLGVQEDNLAITRHNLQLARDRVRLGSSSSADIYRWQAEEARAQILVLNARATVNQAWNRLNRLLHRPQFERIALRDATLDEPFVIKQAEFETLVASPADYARFSQFLVNRGLSHAPELAQVDSQIAAKRRDLTSQRRSYWLPDFSLSGGYSSNFEQSGTGAGIPAGQGLDDWMVGLKATLPLFSGGQRRASVSRAGFELRQLESQRTSTSEKVEESIRVQLHATQAAYREIELSATAAEASLKNYELVADAYARGTVSIIQLLDAQEASLTANGASFGSRYGFLITVMALQRSVGQFDYLLPTDDQVELANALRDYLSRAGR